MDRRYPTFLALCMASLLHAQAPPRMSYQAVVRDGGNALVTNATVGLRLSVLIGSDTGSPVYVEEQSGQTNANGLVSVVIGSGTPLTGDVATIDWGTGPYFLRSEVDPSGGSNYAISGTSELLSVPYALYAANSEPGPAGPPGMPGVGGCDPNTRDSLIVLHDNATAHGYYQDPSGAGAWISQTIGGTNHSAISSKRAVVLYNNSTAYAFHLDNEGVGQWSLQVIGGTNHTAVASDQSVVLYNQSSAYAFHVDGAGAGTWTVEPLGNTNHSNQAHGNKIVVWNNSLAHAFSVDATGTGAWTTQTLGGTTQIVRTTR